MGLKEKLKEHEEGLDEVKKNKKIQQFKQFEKRYNQEKKKKKAEIDNGRNISYPPRLLKECDNSYSLSTGAAKLYVALEQTKELTFSDHIEKAMASKIIEFKEILEQKELGKDHQVYKDLKQLAEETLESSEKGVEIPCGLKNYEKVIETLKKGYS